jgi:alpha-tubulin suppressor-like RCC1 family protein
VLVIGCARGSRLQSRAEGPFLAAGARHTCALSSSGTVRCWGDNSFRQLGRSAGGGPAAGAPVDLGSGRRARAIFAGANHTCAILDGGEVKCWGLNSHGQLGVGDDQNRGDGVGAMGDALAAVDLGRGRRAVTLAPGGTATCALLDDGRVKCWGDAFQGALGYGDTDTRGASPKTMGDELPVVDLGSRWGFRFKAETIAAIGFHGFCAIVADSRPTESGLKCWGSNDFCELGIGKRGGGRGAEPGTMGNNLPFVDLGTTPTGTKRKAVAMAGGFQFVCVLGDDGAVKCWGDNGGGQLGIGASGTPRSCEPGEMGNAGLVPLSGPAVAIAARGLSDGAGAHACARLATGAVTCWGENGFGQLGTGNTTSVARPSGAIALGEGFAAHELVLGNEHSCAISTDRRVKCWGSNRHGQLGASIAADLHPSPTTIDEFGGGSKRE